MFRRLWKLITNNFGLKLLATLFAVMLWLVVVNVDDPKISQRFTTSVVIENTEYLTNQGKYFEIADDNNTIAFTVTAKRSYLEKLSNTDFKATANMENAELDSDSGTGRVPIEVTALRYNSQLSISKATQNLNIILDELDKAQFIVAAETSGELPDDCAIGNVSVSPNLLKISGPKAVVSRIDHVIAPINVTGMTTDVVDRAIPILYDKDGNVVDKKELTMNLDTVTVSVQILDIKEVSLIFNVSGTPAEGYTYVGMTTDPKKIAIKGTASALNSVTAISIPERALDISGAREDITQIIDVTEYLPSGVTIADRTKAKVTVKVQIEQLASRTVNLFPSSIEVLNLQDNYELGFETTILRLTLSGTKADIDALEPSRITASIDAGQLTPGSHEIELALELPPGIQHEPIMVRVRVRDEDAPDTDVPDESDDQSDDSAMDDDEEASEDISTDTENVVNQ